MLGENIMGPMIWLILCVNIINLMLAGKISPKVQLIIILLLIKILISVVVLAICDHIQGLGIAHGLFKKKKVWIMCSIFFWGGINNCSEFI